MMNTRWLMVLLLGTLLAACGEEQSSTSRTSPDDGTEAGVEDSPDETPDPVLPDEDDPEPAGFVGKCGYTNPFSQGAECKEYTGQGWTAEAASADCAQVLGGTPGDFVAGERCSFPAVLGRCSVEQDGGEDYLLLSAGDDPEACAGTVLGCETFLGGTFTPASICGGEPGGSVVDGFIEPFQTCSEPLAGEPAGLSEGGLVCTQNAIQGSTEPGRAFQDYADCDVVRSQRPYYSVPVPSGTDPDDPRLADPEFVVGLSWVTDQVRSSACVCCHAGSVAADGASVWDIEDEGIWLDSVSDNGLAMLAGLADSRSFGAFRPEDNNGFDRDTTGLPTTDVDRMRSFLLAELQRRDPDALDRDFAPFGGPLYDQSVFEPGACEGGEGVSADGQLTWAGGPARFVYVLEAGTDNPGVPPNLDLPEGTIWRMDAPMGGTRLETPIQYGTGVEGMAQTYPVDGEAPALVPGQEYYLYVLFDVALPLTRCTFTFG